MKRKLNDDDIPTAVDVENENPNESAFGLLGLESRLLQAVAKQNFSKPTPVQTKAIPLALGGKDILGTIRLKPHTWRALIADRPSSLTDWLWQDRSLHPPNTPVYPWEKKGTQNIA